MFFSELDTAGVDNGLDSSVLSASKSSFNRSTSNPDLSPSSISNKSMSSSTNSHMNDEEHSAFVLKVYRSDQSFKYFPVFKVKINFLKNCFCFFLFLGYNSKTCCYVSSN